MKPIQKSSTEIEEALSDLIDGISVKRTQFFLFQNQTDLKSLFKQLLTQKSFHPKNLFQIKLNSGFRFQAFYIDEKNSTAYFGWIIWEKFHYLNERKIWISEKRENNGDWTLYFEEKDNQLFWVNETMEISAE